MPGRYPDSWIEEVIHRSDIVQVVSSYVPLKKKGRKYWGLCPFHGEKTASFSVDEDSQLYYCFGCKAGGSVIRFVMDMEHMNFPETLVYLAERAHLPVPDLQEDPEYERRQNQKQRLLNANREAARFFHQVLYSPDGQQSLDYLRGRGITDNVIRRFGLGASPSAWDGLIRHLTGMGFTIEELHTAGLIVVKDPEPATENAPAKPKRQFDMFRNRAMFPIIDAHGNVLGFGGRILGQGEPKYMNTSDTPVFNKRLGVYAANLLHKERHLERVILVEGYMDVIALSQFGVPGVVATLGTALTVEQAHLLKRYAPVVYLAYDGDKAGQNAILRGLDILREAGVPARVLDFPDGQDPDEFIRARGAEAFAALPVLSPEAYRLRRLRDGVDLTKQEGKTEYARAAAPLLRNLDPVEQENLLQELMLHTGFSREVLLAQIQLAPAQSSSPLPPQRPSISGLHGNRNAEGDRNSLYSVVRCEEQLISLFASGRLPMKDFEGVVDETTFTDPLLKEIFEALRSGRSPAAIVSLQQTPEDTDRASRLMSDLVAEDTNQMLQMVEDTRRRLSLAHLMEEREEIVRQLKTGRQLSSQEQTALFTRLTEVQNEISRLQKSEK